MLSLCLAGLLLYLLARQLWLVRQELDAGLFWAKLQQPANWWRLLLVLLMMPLNWLLETIKWRLLLRPFHDWSFSRVGQAVMAGVSVSAATPNRVGEMGGRLLVASKAEIPGVLASSLLGSLAQWIVFLLLALPALLWVGADLVAPAWQSARWVLLGLGPFFLLLLWWLGQAGVLRLLRYLERRWKLESQPLQQALQRVDALLLAKGSGWAALRFWVYVTQLYLLLYVFGWRLPYWEGVAGIAAIYLIQAGIPLPPGVNLLTRVQLGILLWGNSPEVVAASLIAFSLLFVVNVLLPGLMAYFLILRKILT